LWHENIIDTIASKDKRVAIPFYSEVLDNICFADYIDRITFQKQIWIFNEMSSLIKTFYNNKIYHDKFGPDPPTFNPPDVRFTKVLTKYSTEYNNNVFIETLCSKLNLDRSDLLSFFIHIRKNNTITTYNDFFESLEITKLDVQRMYRFIDNFISN